MANKYPGIDPFITTTIESKLRNLKGKFGIRYADLDEIAQKLHIHVWLGLQELKAGVSSEAAVNQIVNNAIIDEIRHRQCQCRDWKLEVLFSELRVFDDESDGDRESIFDIAADMNAGCGKPSSWHEEREQQADVKQSITDLPDALRDLANALILHDGNVMAAARELGLSRKRARLMHETLKEVFG